MKLSMDNILLMNAMEKITGVSPKDCLVENNLVSFFVPEKLMGKAIGKKAVNIKLMEEKLNKRIELIPFSEKPEDSFAKSLEVNYLNTKRNNGKLIITLNQAGKGKAFKNNLRIKRIKEFIERNYGLELIVN
jgi:N utilization substance protein A